MSPFSNFGDIQSTCVMCCINRQHFKKCPFPQSTLTSKTFYHIPSECKVQVNLNVTALKLLAALFLSQFVISLSSVCVCVCVCIIIKQKMLPESCYDEDFFLCFPRRFFLLLSRCLFLFVLVFQSPLIVPLFVPVSAWLCFSTICLDLC